MSELSCQKIVKTYGGRDVLHGVDLVLESGKIYGLIGRNGAGKTTLLSIMTGQNPASAGEVRVDGQPVWENREALSRLCFSRELSPMAGSSQNPLKVKEYLEIAEAFYPHWDKETANRLVEKFRLDPKKRLGKLSKGMLSMVTIIVALASKAEFTLLDEPAAGLDVVAREQFYRLLLEEYQDTGRTFLISTHIIEEAADVFEEVILLDEGKILLKEDTQELLDRAYHISGRAELVDAATEGLALCHEERLGRSKGASVLLPAGRPVPAPFARALSGEIDVDIQKLSLQKLFVALCGEEERS